MKYRIVRVQSGNREYFEVWYRKWFIWRQVYHWRFEYAATRHFVSQEDAQEFIESLHSTRTVVHEQEIRNKFVRHKE